MEKFCVDSRNFLGNHKAPNYAEIVQNILTKFKILKENMTNKLDYIRNRVDTFSDNFGNFSEK